MQQWEYLHFEPRDTQSWVSTIRQMNRYGEEGWELVTTWHHPATQCFFFKRPLPAKP